MEKEIKKYPEEVLRTIQQIEKFESAPIERIVLPISGFEFIINKN